MFNSRLVRKNLLLLAYIFISTFFIFRSTKQTYGVNDDVILQSWLSGTYTGNPELMIRGSATPKITFGFLISNLYKIFPNINWFSLIVLFLVLVSWYLIGTVVLKNKGLVNVSFYLIVSFSHLYWFIPAPTYTASAILFSSSIIFFLIQKDRKTVSIIFLSILFSFSYLIRPESFLFGALISIPLFIYSVVILKKITFYKALLFFLITFSIISIDNFFENSYYKNNLEWQNYETLESLRYKIQANQPEALLTENPLKYNWTTSEVKLFSQYLTFEKSTFNVKKYEVLLEKTKNEKTISLNPVTFIMQGHLKLINSDVNWEWFSLSKLIPISWIFFLILLFPKIRHYTILSLVSLCLLYFVMIYVATYLRQPERVQLSAIFLSILIPLFIYNSIPEKIINNKLDLTKLTLGSFLILQMLTFSVSQIKYFDKKYSGANNVFWYLQKEFLKKFPEDSIFVGNASQFRNNWTNPYVISHDPIEDRIFSLGWHNFSPHWIKRGLILGLDPNNLTDSLIHDRRVYFVSDRDTFGSLQQYLVDKKIRFTQIETIDTLDFVGNDYTVYKISAS